MSVNLSIVTTLYRSASYLEEFYRRSSAVAQDTAKDNYEIILVNDGSPDDSLKLAIDFSKNDKHVTVVDLSRNFGHHNAMLAGLGYANGDIIFLIDADLEEEPEWFFRFYASMTAENADVVYGVQKKRKGGLFERISGYVSYSLLNLLTNIDHPRNVVTARTMTRRYVDALLMYSEREVAISCLWVLAGFRQCAIPVIKHKNDNTSYRYSMKVNHLINAITATSEKPLRFIFYSGILIFLSSVFFAGILVCNRLFFAVPVDGWTSIMVSIWLLGGLIISFIGVIGIYLAKVFAETKQRPRVIIRDIYGSTK